MRFDTPPSRTAIAGLLVLGIGSSVLAGFYGHYAQARERQVWLASKARVQCRVLTRVEPATPALPASACERGR